MADDLEARLQGHARAFEGLMSLLPPDLYYGKQNTQDEWKKKKQTKAEKKAAKLAKLDPANHKTAKDVADERDRKRTLEDEEAERAAAGIDGDLEQPGEGLKQPKAKKQKTAKDQDVHSSTTVSASKDKGPVDAKPLRKKEKQKLVKEKKETKKAKAAEKKAKKEDPTSAPPADLDSKDADQEEAEIVQLDQDMDVVELSGLNEEEVRKSSSRSTSPAPEFSPEHVNGTTSSTSSLQQATEPETPPHNKAPPEKSKPDELEHGEPKASRDELLARLRAQIEASRKERKADGIAGKAARSRSELVEARRQEAQRRKEKKKELRAKEKEELKKKEMEDHLASLRGSPSLGQSLFSPRSRSGSISSPRVEANSFSFGRVAFGDGSRLNPSNNELQEVRKKKGPQDARTALEAAEKKASRIAALDPVKRADVEEKDAWLNARKRIAGEKVKDDVSLLKKSLKRKEKLKGRSERQWGERLEGVQKSQEARQRKREDNLAKRREEKGAKGKKKARVAKKGVKKSRPGFEGTFRGRS